MKSTLEDYPKLVSEFHPTKNGDASPKDFTRGSSKRVWWICSKGHEWEAIIANRTHINNPTNCPYCAGQKVSNENSLQFNFPELAKEWHPTKNGNKTPKDFTQKSGKEVWWICDKGHEYSSRVSDRTLIGNNCPYCSNHRVSKDNNLSVTHTELVKEWHPTKNGDKKPSDFTYGTATKVWWKCIAKGHEWETAIHDRTSTGSNCPYCSNQKIGDDNNLKVLFPEIAAEWHPTKNGDKKPENFASGSNNIKIWWQCSKGHEWDAVIQSRTRGTNCPKCKMQTSKPEFRILSELETIFDNVKSRHRIKNNEIDIFIEDINVGVEYDGSHWHKDKETIDKKKNEFLSSLGVELFRVRRSPLKEITLNDIIVEDDDLKKTDLNKLINKIADSSDEVLKTKINDYLQSKEFVDEDSYKKYLSYFPSPIPEKSLTSLEADFVKEWNFTKNHPLKPEQFSTNSNHKVWWICDKGHEWESIINNRFKGTDCPYCSGRFATTENNLAVLYPELVKEWHPTKNGDESPENFKIKSQRKVWWICSEGHEYESIPRNRTEGIACPYCSGRYPTEENNLERVFPKIAKEFHPTKNGEKTPKDFTPKSAKKVWWICSKGHEWEKSIVSRTSAKSKCPICKKLRRTSS